MYNSVLTKEYNEDGIFLSGEEQLSLVLAIIFAKDYKIGIG